MAFGKPKTPLTPEQQLQRRQNIGVGLAALSESLRGGDPVGRTLGLQQQLEAQQQQAEQDRLLQQFADDPRYADQIKLIQAGLDPRMFAAQKMTADQENYNLAVKQGYKGTFMDYMKEKKAPLVTIDQRQKVFEQEAAKAGFKTQQEAAKTVEGYSDIENRLDILAKQLEGADPVQTGVIEEIKIPFKKIAAGLNILPQEKLDELSQQELFQATTNYIIPRMRVAGSGSTSDREIELFKSSVPNLGNTVAGNKTLVGGLQAIAKYNKKRLFEMDKYLKDNGNLLGFGEFADAKLGPVYETYISDDDFDKKVREGKLKKGDFVYDALSGQFRVLSEEDIKGAM